MKFDPMKGAGASPADLRTVARGSLIQFVGMGTSRGANLAFVAIMIRFLGAADFGVYRQVAQLLMTVTTIAMLGFDAALLRTVAQARARGELGAVRSAARTAITTVTVVSLVLLVVLVLFADDVMSAFADTPAQRDQMAFLIRLGAAYVPMFALAKVLGTGAMGFKTVVPSVMVDNVLQPVSLLVMSTAAVAAGYGVGGAVGGLLTSAVVALLVAGWFFWNLIPQERSQPSVSSSLRSMAGFALPRAGAHVLRWGAAGTLLLGILGTDRDVAVFAIATALQGIVLIFPQAFLGIWQPIVVDLVERKETQRLEGIYQTINRWVASCSFGLIIALVVLPDPFVQVLGGSSVRDAALLTSVIAAGTLIQVGTGHCGALVTMAGYPVINLLSSVGVLILYVISAWLIVPSHGALGMAIIHASSVALVNLVLMVAAKRLTGLQPFGSNFLKPVAAMCLAGIVLVIWRMWMPQRLVLDLLGLALTAGVYGVSLWVAGTDAEDRVVLERLRERLRIFRYGR